MKAKLKRKDAIVLGIINHKGGVGKTATASGLAGALKKKGYKVLAIDADSQANLTDSFGFPMDQDETLYEALKNECELPICNHPDGIDIVPSCLGLSTIEAELSDEPGRELLLASLLKPIKKDYDFIIIDCPPSLSLLTINAMTAANGIIIPVQVEYLAMRGMARLLTVIDKVQQRLNSKLEIEGILLTMYDSRKNLHQITVDTIQTKFPDQTFNTIIRTNVAIAEATSYKRDVVHYAPRSSGATDYMSLADEIISNHNH